MGVVCGYLIVLVFIYGTDDDNKLGSWRKKKLKKDRSFQNETIKYEIVFVIERNSYS